MIENSAYHSDNLTEILPAVNARDTANKIVNSLTADKIVLILCKCDVEYEGRASGYLPEGNRTIVLKPDGNFLVMGSTKHKPRNWQPTGAETTVSVKDEHLALKSTRTSPQKESIVVHCETIHEAIIYNAGNDPDVSLEGTEKDMHNHIMSNPEVIEKGFKPIENERPVDDGRAIDVYGIDKNNAPVVIEVKRRRGQRKHVDQLKQYTEAVKEQHPNVRGILVAPSASNAVFSALEKRGLEFVKLKPKVCPTPS